MIPEDIAPLFRELGFTDFSSMTTQDFCQGAAALLGTEASMLDGFELDFSLTKDFPPALAARCQAIPLRREKDHLSFALVDPFNKEATTLLQWTLAEPLEQIVAPPERVEQLLHSYCTNRVASPTPVADHVDALLEHAVINQASDLHLDPLENEWNVRYRIDGVLQEGTSFSKSLGLAILSRIKLMAHLNIAEQRRSQDGRLEYRPRNNKKTNAPRVFRIATLPTQFGESLVLRLLDRHATGLSLEELPFSPSLRTSLLQLLQEPHGLFIVTGPTGSGKTTTLYSCLQHLHHDGTKIMTVEDPVEYELEGALQIQINETIGLSFTRTLRSLLRHDPDIIMIGETRDAGTANMALQASLTGHRVLTTLHTADTASTIARLLELGGEATTLATILRGVLAQRLLRTLCQSCRKAYEPGKEELLSLGLSNEEKNIAFYRAEGCDECEQTGYKGRRPIFELFLVNAEIQTLIHQGASHLLLQEKAIERGMRTLRQEALRVLQEGLTTVEEVLQWT